VYRFQIRQLVVISVHARAEEESRVSSIDYFAATAELDEVGLVFLVSWSDEAVNLAFELDLFVVGVRIVPFR
jgi:hypothetical protein